MMKKAVIVDFDLTLVKVNSFEFFYKELIKYAFCTGRINWVLFLVYIIVQRKLRFISHAELKRRTLYFLDSKRIDTFLYRFAKFLKPKLSYNVVSYYEKYRAKGYSIYLCTAAPELYVIPFLSVSGLIFDDVICTPTPKKGKMWLENLNEKKKETILKLLKQRDKKIAVLMTDHRDDLPLLILPKEKNILVNPTIKTLKEVGKCGIDYEVMRFL